MAEIAVLGLGAMGARMAARLVAAGHRVRVWNRSPGRAATLVAQGAIEAASPADAARGAGFALAMLRDDEASRATWLDPDRGGLGALEPGAVAIESSTLSPGCMLDLARRCAEARVGFLDAPVAGSRPQAEAGQLVHLVGGSEATLEAARTVLAALGSVCRHVGPAGAGTVTKLAVNALLAVQVATLAEWFAALRRHGIDPSLALEAIGATAVASPALRGAGASMVAGAFAPLFPVELAWKDCRYAAEAADDAPMTRAVERLLARAVEAGLGPDHLSGIVRLHA